MSARAYAFMTGIFIIALVGAIAAASYWFGGSHVARQPYTVVANHSIIGLHGQSTVYYRGVPVGHVTNIELAPHNVRQTLIGVNIDASIPVTAGTYATLRTQGVTGLATIELNDTGNNPKRLPTSPKRPARIPLHGGAGSLTSAGQQLAKKLNKVADSLQDIVNPANRRHISVILSNTAQLTAQLSRLEKKLDTSLDGFPALTRDARHTLHRADVLSAHLIKLTDSLHDLSSNLKGFGHSGQVAAQELARQTLPKLGATMNDLRQTARALQDLSRSLERNPQQLLFGPAGHPPGPGEAGFKDSKQQSGE